jgi:hypothetical protein
VPPVFQSAENNFGFKMEEATGKKGEMRNMKSRGLYSCAYIIRVKTPPRVGWVGKLASMSRPTWEINTFSYENLKGSHDFEDQHITRRIILK